MRLTNDNSTNWDFTVGNTGYYQGNLFISNPAIANEQFTLGSTGNVGINVFNPGQRLTVGGNISASGNGYFACVIAGGYFEQKAANKTRDPVYGSVIAQSMEAGTGDSHLVKAMIRKM
jgi:hypothetical protein